MLTCPMCKKVLPEMQRECKFCRTDVSLLVDYVENLQEGLDQAEALTKAGELGEAVWAYLAVLEVDPDNTTARRQVGKVATAVRQFDQAAPGRRWLKRLQKQTRFRRWMARWGQGEGGEWVNNALWFILIVGVLLLGYALGYWHARNNPVPMPHVEEPESGAVVRPDGK